MITKTTRKTVKELKEICKIYGIKGYSKLNRNDLIDLLINFTPTKEADKAPASLNVKELKARCKELGLRRYSKLRKAELIALIESTQKSPQESISTDQPHTNKQEQEQEQEQKQEQEQEEREIPINPIQSPLHDLSNLEDEWGQMSQDDLYSECIARNIPVEYCPKVGTMNLLKFYVKPETLKRIPAISESVNYIKEPKLLEEIYHIWAKVDRCLYLLNEEKEMIATIGQKLTLNPNTPVDIYLSLASAFPKEFMKNPILSLLQLANPEFWSKKVSISGIIKLIQNKLLRKSIVFYLWNHIEHYSNFSKHVFLESIQHYAEYWNEWIENNHRKINIEISVRDVSLNCTGINTIAIDKTLVWKHNNISVDWITPNPYVIFV